MDHSVSIKSVRDSTCLTFSAIRSESFTATVEGRTFSARVDVSTYINGSPSLLFADLAQDWSGWKNEKSWAALENELRITATVDHTGHVRLGIVMNNDGAPTEWSLRATLHLEAGQLEAVARAVESAFKIDANA